MELFIFGSWLFWILIAAMVILEIVATEKGSGVGATATLIITLVILFIFGNKGHFRDFFISVGRHPWMALSSVLVYIIFGVCWAVAKWYLFLIKARDKVIENQKGSSYPIVRRNRLINFRLFKYKFTSNKRGLL